MTQCFSIMEVKSLGTPNMIRLKMTPFTPCTRSKQFWLIYRSLFLRSNVYNYQNLRPRFLPLIKSKQCCIHVHPVHFTRPPPIPPPLPEKCLFFTTLFARSKGEGIVIRDVRGIGKVDLMLHLHIWYASAVEGRFSVTVPWICGLQYRTTWLSPANTEPILPCSIRFLTCGAA